MFQLRRTAFRLISSPSTSFVSKSRSITNISHSALKTSRQSSVPLYQRRWASDEAEKKEDVPIEKTEPTAKEEAEAAAQSTKGNVESATGTVSEAVSSAVDTVKEAVTSTLNSQSPASDEPKSTIYIGNLFFDVIEKDLETEFSRFGEIEKVTLIRDGRGLSKGFGYINFKSAEAASKAKEEMNQALYEGRRVTIQFAQKIAHRENKPHTPLNPPTKTLWIGNISYEITDKDLNALFKGIKNVIDVRVAIDRRTGQPRGFAHADFIDVKSAIEAEKLLTGKEIYGRKLRIDFGMPATKRPEGRQRFNQGRSGSGDAQ